MPPSPPLSQNRSKNSSFTGIKPLLPPLLLYLPAKAARLYVLLVETTKYARAVSPLSFLFVFELDTLEFFSITNLPDLEWFCQWVGHCGGDFVKESVQFGRRVSAGFARYGFLFKDLRLGEPCSLPRLWRRWYPARPRPKKRG